MQVVGVFCRVAIALLMGWTLSSEASGLIAALSGRNITHSKESWAEKYVIFVAPRGINGKALPEPRLVELPATAGIYDAKDWWITTLKSGPCFLPEGALLTVTSLAETKVIGSLIWPDGYFEEPLRCRDRQFPQDGRCEFDKQPPSVPVCTNGAMVLMDLSEAVDVSGQPLDPSVPMAGIKKALGL